MLGGYLTRGLDAPQLWIAALVAATLVAAAIVINDCLDVKPDRINKPARPLPNGRLSLSGAWLLGNALVVTGLGLSLSLHVAMPLLAALVAVLLYVYSLKIKRIFLLGNLVVSAMTALTVIYGGMAVDNVGPTLVPALVVGVFMLGREILKTAEDYHGDLVSGVRTIAVVWGKQSALRLFSALSAAVALLLLLPWWVGDLSPAYLLIALPGDGAILLSAAYLAWNRSDRHAMRIALRGTRAAAFVWLAAMFIGVAGAA